tara:strand:- start:5606 stop:8392 length:2787 start_codon:yes stop_codon:yes gene_type:complete
MARRLKTIARWVNENLQPYGYKATVRIEGYNYSVGSYFGGNVVGYHGSRDGTLFQCWELTDMENINDEPNSYRRRKLRHMDGGVWKLIKSHNSAEPYRYNREVESFIRRLIGSIRSDNPDAKVADYNAEEFEAKESNCVRCNKHPKKAGESVCKVCYDSGSGYFDMVGNDLADYFEWPDDKDAEEFGAEWRGRWDVGMRRDETSEGLTYYINKITNGVEIGDSFEVLVRPTSEEAKLWFNQIASNPQFKRLTRGVFGMLIGRIYPQPIGYGMVGVKPITMYQIILPTPIPQRNKNVPPIFQLRTNPDWSGYGYETKERAYQGIRSFFDEIETPLNMAMVEVADEIRLEAEEFGAEDIPAHLAKWKMDYQFTARNGELFDIYNLGDECLKCGFYEYYKRNGIWYCSDCRAKKSGQRNAEEFGAEAETFEARDKDDGTIAYRETEWHGSQGGYPHQGAIPIGKIGDERYYYIDGKIVLTSPQVRVLKNEYNVKAIIDIKRDSWDRHYKSMATSRQIQNAKILVMNVFKQYDKNTGFRRGAEEFGAESPQLSWNLKLPVQVGDEGMFEGGEVRITNIEDNSENGRQNVYFFTYLDEEGNSDGFIHTSGERKFLNQFTMFPRDWNAEEFEAESRVMNEELMESIMNVFLKNNIRDKREQLKELMFIYGALEEEMYMGAEEFGAETDYDDYIQRIFTFIDEKVGTEYFGGTEDEGEVARFKEGFNNEFDETSKIVEDANDWSWEGILGAEEFGAESDYTLKDWWQQSMDNCICGGNGCLYCEEINKDYDENIALSDLRKISKIVGTDCHCDKTYEDDVLQCYNCQTAMTLEKFGAESRIMDEDEIMEHYVFYWEEEDDSGNIPLNYEEWKENHLEDLIMIMGLDAESFEATKGMDTYAQPFSELKIKPTKTKVGILIATIVAGGFWYSKKMKE